jgi:hypothetical protein
LLLLWQLVYFYNFNYRFLGSSTAWQPMHCFAPTNVGKFVHERSHSDTPNPLPSVDLSAESRYVYYFNIIINHNTNLFNCD